VSKFGDRVTWRSGAEKKKGKNSSSVSEQPERGYKVIIGHPIAHQTRRNIIPFAR